MTSMTCDTYGMWNEIEFEMLECWNVGMLEMLEWDSKWNGTQSGMGLKVEWDSNHSLFKSTRLVE